MSMIAKGEPKHWHDADGRHRMTDPRTITSIHERYRSPDDKAFVAHLEQHEGEHVERSSCDEPEISALFDLIEHNEIVNTKMRMLILALRQRPAPEKG